MSEHERERALELLQRARELLARLDRRLPCNGGCGRDMGPYLTEDGCLPWRGLCPWCWQKFQRGETWDAWR